MNEWVHDKQIPETSREHQHRYRNYVVALLLIGAGFCFIVAFGVVRFY